MKLGALLFAVRRGKAGVDVVTLRRILLAVLLLSLPLCAWPGKTCQVSAVDPDAVRKGLQLALKTRASLESSGARAVVIGRIGSDLSDQGLRYSHAGIAWRDDSRGRWIVTHLLNHCGSPKSGLFEEGLGNFFMDQPFAYETIVVVPSPAVQARLMSALDSRLADSVFTSDYSMIASPYSTRYQNSNQWLLELIALSLSDLIRGGREEAQQVLRNSGYMPARVRISGLRRLGASLFAANVRFDDHSAQEASSGRYEIVSVESVISYLSKLDPGARSFVLSLN